MLKIYCMLTGDEYNLVRNETPESKKKIKLLGMVMLLPVFMSFIQIYLVSTNILKIESEYALIASLFAGILIFIIERSIVLSNGRIGLVLSRIAMGFLIALLGALVFDELIFRYDIDMQLEKNIRSENAVELKNWTDFNRERINIQQQITENAYDDFEKQRKIYIDEINGSYGSTGVRGVGNVANQKEKLLEKAELIYISEKQKLDSMRNGFENEKNEFMSKLESQNKDGLLLHRVKAMFDLIFTETILMIVFGAFTILFLLIEVTVVMVKMFHRKTNYERMNELKEKIGESRMNVISKKDTENFNASSVHPDVIRLNNHLKKNVPGIF